MTITGRVTTRVFVQLLACVQNDVEGSLQDFDRALAASPQLNPYLWQRGLSLYYVQQYTAGAKQFRYAGSGNDVCALQQPALLSKIIEAYGEQSKIIEADGEQPGSNVH